MLPSAQLGAGQGLTTELPVPAAFSSSPPQLTQLLALTFSIAGLRFVSSFHQAQVSCVMPQSINCCCAGEAGSSNRSLKLLANIWIWGTEWKVCIVGNIWRKKLLPDAFGQKCC